MCPMCASSAWSTADPMPSQSYLVEPGPRREMTSKIADIRQSYIDGRFVRGDGAPLAVENPATEEIVAEVETLTVAQMEGAIHASRRAFDSGGWSGLRREERVEKVLAMGEYLRGRADEMAATLTAEAGAPQIILGAQVQMPLDHLRAAC